jgi:hypothetical protein
MTPRLGVSVVHLLGRPRKGGFGCAPWCTSRWPPPKRLPLGCAPWSASLAASEEAALAAARGPRPPSPPKRWLWPWSVVHVLGRFRRSGLGRVPWTPPSGAAPEGVTPVRDRRKWAAGPPPKGWSGGLGPEGPVPGGSVWVAAPAAGSEDPASVGFDLPVGPAIRRPRGATIAQAPGPTVRPVVRTHEECFPSARGAPRPKGCGAPAGPDSQLSRPPRRPGQFLSLFACGPASWPTGSLVEQKRVQLVRVPQPPSPPPLPEGFEFGSAGRLPVPARFWVARCLADASVRRRWCRKPVACRTFPPGRSRAGWPVSLHRRRSSDFGCLRLHPRVVALACAAWLSAVRFGPKASPKPTWRTRRCPGQGVVRCPKTSNAERLR